MSLLRKYVAFLFVFLQEEGSSVEVVSLLHWWGRRGPTMGPHHDPSDSVFVLHTLLSASWMEPSEHRWKVLLPPPLTLPFAGSLSPYFHRSTQAASVVEEDDEKEEKGESVTRSLCFPHPFHTSMSNWKSGFSISDYLISIISG